MQIRTALCIAAALNAGMFFIEGAGALYAGSAALLADAMDFLEDTGTYALTLFMLDKPWRWRALAGLAKGVAEAAMGVGVLWLVAARISSGTPPDPVTMGAVGTLALAVNLGCALLLLRCRRGDSNLRSAWLASRNDAVANIAVLAAAGGVAATASVWPDVAAAAGIAAVNLTAAHGIIKQALAELKSKPQEDDS
jgi:Co/Zn/Cd efflux system component